jgi:hypothetical protein
VKRKIFLHPGWISIAGQPHYVGSKQLAQLYGVPNHECRVITEHDNGRFLAGKNDLHLYPREDGNYVMEDL